MISIPAVFIRIFLQIGCDDNEHVDDDDKHVIMIANLRMLIANDHYIRSWVMCQ